MITKSSFNYRDSKALATVKKAIKYAGEHHKGQVRKSMNKEPMLTHCLNVGDILVRSGASESTVAAGILHDTVEDTVVTNKKLVKTFGNKVASLVDCVTEKCNLTDWMERCNAYLAKLKQSPVDAMCISAADKIDNMRSITENVSQGYNIFQNMVGTPQMQLKKFKGVYEIVKGKVPKKLEVMYKEALDNFVNVLKKNKFLA